MEVHQLIVQRVVCYWALACLPIVVDQIGRFRDAAHWTDFVRFAAVVVLPGFAVHRAYLDQSLGRLPAPLLEVEPAPLSAPVPEPPKV